MRVRDVNVGGKNKLAMSALSERLTDLGLEDVSTVLASGNVLLRSSKSARTLGQQIESVLVEDFGLHEDPVKVLVLTAAQVEAVVEEKPTASATSRTYHFDAIFVRCTAIRARTCLPRASVNPGALGRTHGGHAVQCRSRRADPGRRDRPTTPSVLSTVFQPGPVSARRQARLQSRPAVVLGVSITPLFRPIVAAPGGLSRQVDLEPDVLLPSGVEDQVRRGDVLRRNSHGLVQRDLSR